MDSSIKKIMDLLSVTVFDMPKIMENKHTFNDNIDTIYDYLKQGFEIKELREYPVKFILNDEKIPHKLQLRHFLTNLMFWEPLVRLDKQHVLDESFIVNCSKISSKLIKDYIDNKYVKPYKKEISNRKMNKLCHDLIFRLSTISKDFNIILAMSMNVETFIDVAERIPRFNEIIRTKLDENMQPTEIEKHVDSLMHEQIDILKNDPKGNLLQPILLSGTGIKNKQLSEFSISGNLKPDIVGKTIPIPINSNFIVGGLSNLTNYYIDSLAGRKALIMSKLEMGNSGHFSRMIMLLVSSIQLSKDTDTCNTVHPIKINLKTVEHLKKMIDRYYRTKYSREYKIIKGDEYHLIGEDIFIKSPATCACGDSICKTCYGDLYYTNRDIGIGSYASTKITEPVSQNILSSKHLLTTKSENIEFTDPFYKFFSLSANEIMLNNSPDDDDDLNDYSLLIIKKNIMTISDFGDDDTECNEYVNIFHVYNKKTDQMIEIFELKGKDLFISPELKKLFKKNNKDVYEIDFKLIDSDSRLFIFEIMNNELTRPLYDIMKLLDRIEHLGCRTVDEMCQTMLDLMIESEITAMSVHSELIITLLLRDKDDILKRPRFDRYFNDDNGYQILTVKAALEKHPSVLIGLSFQALDRQLSNPLTFRKKDSSFIDSFFKEKP